MKWSPRVFLTNKWFTSAEIFSAYIWDLPCGSAGRKFSVLDNNMRHNERDWWRNVCQKPTISLQLVELHTRHLYDKEHAFITTKITKELPFSDRHTTVRWSSSFSPDLRCIKTYIEFHLDAIVQRRFRRVFQATSATLHFFCIFSYTFLPTCISSLNTNYDLMKFSLTKHPIYRFFKIRISCASIWEASKYIIKVINSTL